MQRVEAHGVEVAFERVGAGPPLVFVHGATADSRLWRPQVDGMADEFTVVAWDEPGAGGSSDVPPDFTLEDYARCLAAVIENVELGPVHLAGLSWGGTIALALYRDRPELVGSLVLADTYAGWKGSLPAEEVEARVAAVEYMLAAPPETFNPVLPGLFAGDPPPDAVPVMEAMGREIRRETMRTSLTVMAETDLSDLLPQIDVPTLLIWGELDARSPLSVAEQFERAIPHAELTVLPGTGHVSNLERPDEFNDALRVFCRANPLGR